MGGKQSRSAPEQPPSSSSKGKKSTTNGGTASPAGGKPKKKKSYEPSDHDRAVLELKLKRDDLAKSAKKSSKLQSKLNKQAIAYMKAGRKDAALNCLKLRKMYQERELKIETMFMNVENTIDSIAESEMNKAVFDTIKTGTVALKSMNASMQNVDQVMDDLHEAIEESRDITALVSQQGVEMGVAAEYDDEELLAELRELNGEKPEPAEKEKEKEKEKDEEEKLKNVTVPADDIKPDPVQAALKDVQVPASELAAKEEEEKEQEKERVAA